MNFWKTYDTLIYGTLFIFLLASLAQECYKESSKQDGKKYKVPDKTIKEIQELYHHKPPVIIYRNDMC